MIQIYDTSVCLTTGHHKLALHEEASQMIWISHFHACMCAWMHIPNNQHTLSLPPLPPASDTRLGVTFSQNSILLLVRVGQRILTDTQELLFLV